MYPCVPFIANILEPNMYMVPVYMVWNAGFWICALAIPMIEWSADTFTSWAKHRLFPDGVDGLKLDDEDDQKKALLPDDRERAGSQAIAQALTAEQEGLFQKHVNLTPYGQQELKCWRIRLTPQSTMKIAIWCGIALFLMGLLVQHFANNAAQVRVIYQMATQGKTLIVSEITWGTNPDEVFEKDRHCIETQRNSTNVLACNATVPREMKPPLLVFYGVGPFYQNIVTYLKSEVSKELMGKDVDDATREEKCLNKNFRERDGNNIVPCGAKAGSLFNDTLELQHNGNRIDINKERVAWKSDIMRYKNPKDYPNRPKTTWLYQLFPDVVKKDEGVENEAFAAWMRPSALGRVWNHYGWIHQNLKKGDKISFNINSFNATLGSKMFFITERNIFGGRHTELGTGLMITGGFCLVLFLIMCLDQRRSDRPVPCVP